MRVLTKCDPHTFKVISKSNREHLLQLKMINYTAHQIFGVINGRTHRQRRECPKFRE